MTDRFITHYIEEERQRCATLIGLIRDEPDFLLYCINAPVYPIEIDEQRKRFAEFPSAPVADNFEDLM